jgi:hypothetical protein
MNWDAIQNDAKAKGHLVFAMAQNQTAVMTQPGPWGSSFDGYCIGLCANWIALQYQGKDFPIAADKTCETPPWRSTQAQTLSDMSKSADWTGWWKEAMSPFTCTLSDGLRASRVTKPTADFLWSIMAQAYGCYGVFLGRDGGAHAIALRHGRDNRYHLFAGFPRITTQLSRRWLFQSFPSSRKACGDEGCVTHARARRVRGRTPASRSLTTSSWRPKPSQTRWPTRWASNTNTPASCSSYRYFMVGQRLDGSILAVSARNGDQHTFDGGDVEKILMMLDADNKAVL